MNPLWTGGIVTLIALVFLFSGMPIAFALGVTSLIAIFLFMDVYQISMMAETIYEGVNDFSLLSIPLFLFMGMIVAISRAGGDLYECFHRWLYKIPGGLGIGNIAGCAVFAALTGSSPATAAAIGTMGIPEMRKRGYPDGLATGIITAGGTLGILIPPSVTMIIYGIVTETSIGKLFMAGIIPGLLVALLFAAWVPIGYTLSRRNNPDAFPSQKKEFFTLAQKFSSTLKVLPFIVVVLLVLGSLYTGWATPSEAAAVGAFLILIIAIIFYKMYRPKEILEILLKTTNESTMIMMIIATSFLFGAVLTNLFIAQTLTHMIMDMQVSRWVTMFMINILLLVMGCFLPPVAIILIVSPIIHPIVKVLGFDPVWFGVLMTLNLEAGLITPPVGLNLYVVKGIVPDIPLSTILWGSVPFILLLFLGMLLLCFFPQLATWLPGMMIN
ncbi:MAG: TRAP transporter large permease [Syntrophales bacterium]|jgi:tripartite ATP-independent transporter DctM subunit|nr:TRAP transporter large permease [Syntrophales bacterium]